MQGHPLSPEKPGALVEEQPCTREVARTGERVSGPIRKPKDVYVPTPPKQEVFSWAAFPPDAQQCREQPPVHGQEKSRALPQALSADLISVSSSRLVLCVVWGSCEQLRARLSGQGCELSAVSGNQSFRTETGI